MLLRITKYFLFDKREVYNINIHIKKQVFNEAYLPYLEDYNHRFNVFYGGAGSGKSHFVVQKLIFKYLKYSNRKCLVIRKVGNTLRDSIFAEFKSVLADWQLYSSCDIRETLLTIDLPNGSQFIFKGLDDPEKIKSIANIDDIIIEEATELTLDDFSQLNLRLRSKNPYNQIHLMFNPMSKSNWVYHQWFENGYDKKNTVVIKTTFKDNKFLSNDYINSLLSMIKNNPTYYKIYTLGEFTVLDKLIFTNWKEESFEYKEIIKNNHNAEAVFGLDFGYTNDATAFIAAVIDRTDKKLWIFDEFQFKGMTNDEIVSKINSFGYGKEVVICDSAEPKSIEELQRNGLTRAKAAVKGKDSILNGIQYLQQFDIKINPKCCYIIEEFNNYTWQKDKDNIYINKPIDKYNHGIDALRYAVDGNSYTPYVHISDRKILGI